MKYEITKGSAKDFEGAPAWATMKCHCTVGDPSEIKNENVAFSDGILRGSRWVDAFGDGEEGVIHREEQWHIIAERRPITEPLWDGEGLPPVGSTFDMRLKPNGIWLETKLIAAGQEQIIYFREGMEFSGHKNNYEFRPIRSPEDVARDEAIKAMREALGHAAGLIEISNIYRAIAAGKIPGVKLE